MSEKKMRVFCYCRVASEDQSGDGPLAAQSARLRRFAEEHGLETIGEIRAFEKGLMMERPGWQAALAQATKEKADAVLVVKPDRVARNPRMVMDATNELSKRNMRLLFSENNLPLNTGIPTRARKSTTRKFHR